MCEIQQIIGLEIIEVVIACIALSSIVTYIVILTVIRKYETISEWYHKNSVLENDYHEVFEQILRNRRMDVITTVVITIILSISFFILFICQNLIDKISGIPHVLIEAGIHIPIILFFTGVIIKYIYKNILRVVFDQETEYTQAEIVNGINKITVLLTFCFMFIEPRVGLMTLAIILGKHIWIDTSIEYQGIKSFLTHLVKWPHFNSIDAFLPVTDLYFSVFFLSFSLFHILSNGLW